MPGWAAAESLSARTAGAAATQRPAQKPLPAQERRQTSGKDCKAKNFDSVLHPTLPTQQNIKGLALMLRSGPTHFCGLHIVVCRVDLQGCVLGRVWHAISRECKRVFLPALAAVPSCPLQRLLGGWDSLTRALGLQVQQSRAPAHIARPKGFNGPMQTHLGCLERTHACIMDDIPHRDWHDHNDAFLGASHYVSETHQIAGLSTKRCRAHLGHLGEQRAQGGPQGVCKGGGRVDQHHPVNLRQRHATSAPDRLQRQVLP